jgi:hypothetical protein
MSKYNSFDRDSPINYKVTVSHELMIISLSRINDAVSSDSPHFNLVLIFVRYHIF